MLLGTLECVYLFKLQFSADMCPGMGFLDHMVPSVHRFFRNLHSGCKNLQFRQQHRSVPSFPRPLHHLLYVDFFRMTTVTHVNWYLIVILISFRYSSVIFEHLFMCFVAVGVLSLDTCLLRSFATSLIGKLFFLFLSHFFTVSNQDHPSGIRDTQRVGLHKPLAWTWPCR